jgi:hypothetical protein
VSAAGPPSGAALEPLREALRGDTNVVCAWWTDRQVLAALEDVGGPLDDYRSSVQSLTASVAPILRQYGLAFVCGPVDAVVEAARDGVVVYERDG